MRRNSEETSVFEGADYVFHMRGSQHRSASFSLTSPQGDTRLSFVNSTLPDVSTGKLPKIQGQLTSILHKSPAN